MVGLRSEVKKAFCGYRMMTPVLRSKLKGWGFVILRNKRHIVLCYGTENDSSRVVISCTASDWRTGLNVASKIIRLLGMRQGTP